MSKRDITWRLAACVVGALIFAGLGACGAGSSEVAIQVGRVAISKSTVDHWAAAIARGAGLPGLSDQPNQTPRQRALSFLIASNWLMDEAAARGVAVSDGAIEQRLEKNRSGLPGREREFDESLRVTGQNIADARFEIKAALAAYNIREKLTTEVHIPHVEIADYYRSHLDRFAVSERRYFHIVTLKTKAASLRLKRKAESEHHLPNLGWHEFQDRAAHREAGSGKLAMKRAIFTSRPHQLTGPLRLYDVYSLFEVERIVPATHRPLAQVQPTIEKQLASERQHRMLAEFGAAWQDRWVSKTDCEVGYVVYGCSQYKGSRDYAKAPQEILSSFD